MADTKIENDVPMPMLADWMTRAELAEELNVSTDTLLRWQNLRVGPAPIKLGRKVMYRREKVREWLLAKEQNNPQRLGRGHRLRAER